MGVPRDLVASWTVIVGVWGRGDDLIMKAAWKVGGWGCGGMGEVGVEGLLAGGEWGNLWDVGVLRDLVVGGGVRVGVGNRGGGARSVHDGRVGGGDVNGGQGLLAGGCRRGWAWG